MPIASTFTSIHETKFTVSFDQCYPNGFIRYTDLCNVLQLTAGNHADLGGISFTDMQQNDQAWVLSRMRLEIVLLPKWRDAITVKTWIVSLENSRSVRALEVYSGDEKLVGCETFWAVFNTKTRRPEALALPHEHFEKFGERYPTAHRVKKIDVSDARELVKTRSVLLSDIDIVKHVNNVKYLEWCLDMEASEDILSGKIQSLDMNFMSELMLGDKIDIRRDSSAEKTIMTIEKNERACFALEIGT
ncbi:MAG: acyl-[acyl-carrier-protein] thioesterase [Chitinophagaceae bacterium]|nr:MAG: acyl-[acyl-carrier-protein] thioesterase [Chitinophagaceae bacterium]